MKTLRDIDLELPSRFSVARWAPIPLRLIVGYGFMAHGFAKLSKGPDAFATILQAIGVPGPHFMALTTILVELLGGLALILGAFVTLVSLPMAVVLLVAMFTVHLPYGFSSIKLLAVTAAGAQFGPPGYEMNLLYIACLAALVLGGSGPMSIDGLIGKRTNGRIQDSGISSKQQPMTRIFHCYVRLMRRRRDILPAASAMFLLFPIVFGAEAQEGRIPDSVAPSVETFALTDIKDLVERNVRVEGVEYKGRKAVRLTRHSEGEGLATLRDTQFEDGTIEADVAVKVTTPPSVRNPGFIGIAFRSRPDALHYDMFYLRLGNSLAEDQAMRNHSVQYIASPDFDWERLRRAWPAVYETYADLQLETWTRIKIEVEGRRARLFINGASNPALVVDGLKGEDLKGAVGLWGSAGQESYFSNLRITHTKRQPIENGGEAAGTWEVKYSSDAGNYSCLMKLHREGNTVSGTVSGLLGSDLPVAGAWRSGYLELTFRGTWPHPSPGGATASLAGWIDGNSAKGRLSIHGRADGVWTATRKE